MSDTSLMDLCMKEFAMQQKLGMEFHLQQQRHQQNLMPSPSPFSLFHFGAYSPAADIPSSSSTFFPHQFTTLNQQQQFNKNHSILFDKKSTFVQECSPPTLFDPFATAVAANFMQHFSKPKCAPPSQSAVPQMMPTPMWNGIGQWPMMMGDGPKANISSATSFPNSIFGFGFSQLPESPSHCCASLNSTGSCASLDSFGSSCLPSSPDSSSNSSLQNGGGPPFPLIRANVFRKLTSNQKNGLICWPPMESASSTLGAAIGNRNGLQLDSNMATDFSELLTTNGSSKSAPQKGIPQSGGQQQKILRHENEEEGKKMTKAPTPWMGSTITVQHQFMHKNSATTKKKSFAQEKNQQQSKTPMENFGQRKPSILVLENEDEPPKKMSRKLGTTIFVPLELTKAKKGIAAQKKLATSKNEENSLGQLPTLIPALEFTEMEKNEVNERKITAMKAEDELEIGKGENGDKCMKAFCEQQQEAPLLEVNLSRLKCEFIDLEEAKFVQQNAQKDAENEATFLLAHSPPVLKLEKKNGGEERAKNEGEKRRKGMANLDENKKIMKSKKKTIKKLAKIGEDERIELDGKIEKKMEDENAMKNEEIGVKNAGGEEAEKKKMEPFKLEDLESSSSSICPFVGFDCEKQINGERKEKKGEKMEGNEVEEEVEDEDEGGMVEEEEEEEEREMKVPCRWTNCKEKFEDDDQLYDHMTTAHVELLKKWVLAEQRELEQQRKAGLKRRRSSGGCGGTTSTAKERFRCRWRKCEQFPRRGDTQKKLDWLLKHLVIRHAPKARPYCCIFAGCTLRFPKLDTLRDHLRTAHDDTNNGRGNGRKGGGGTANGGGEDGRTKINCLEFRPCVHLSIVRDCIDARTGEWIRSRLTGEQFAPTFGDEPKLLENIDENLNNKMERAKARKMGNRINSQRNGESKLCKTMEIEDERILEIKDESNDADHLLSSRMSLHDTVNHLKGLFKKMSSR